VEVEGGELMVNRGLYDSRSLEVPSRDFMQYAARGDGDFVIKRLEIDDVFDSFDRVDQCEPHGRAEGPCVIGHRPSVIFESSSVIELKPYICCRR
jgi:hypothetical protein